MSERNVRLFFIAIGAFYLLNLIGTLPFLSGSLLDVMYPGSDLSVEAGEFSLLQDAWAVIGAQLGAIGIIALWAVRDPSRYAAVIPVVIAVEIVDAIWDMYSILFSGEALWFGLATLLIHIIWVAWGFRVWRRLGV
ncbi:BphX family protein [Pseudomonas aeruginosa]|uniref:BphX family protein n=1 Tax=Pseudomonas aeruginosa TaxID=287 RepID=UPI000F82CC0A|nr:BphX family protein [Pseudomonas aeruginosa]MCY4797027.1 BphX family protein [Pseudomonas aeruginosa]MDZ5161808.1 BphX family protein [Pseudomonas aeruginosa]MDZ5173006.1 BphX family protein [Pseudomonas aeruginosa]MDZ5183900.1 BphX family protein [Pseudomonas aeruginosa]MDZ5189215.1 BphX family protein [Pseudomonas aeruginosa]